MTNQPGPQQPQPAQQPAWSPPPKTGWSTWSGMKRGIIAVTIVVALLGIGAYAQSRDSNPNFTVQMTSCTGAGTTASVSLAVENTGSSVATARVDVEYRDAGGRRLDTDTAVIRDIAPGDTARHDESTILDASADGQITCKVTRVH